MSLLIHPNADAPIDHMKLHRDISVIAKGLAALVVIGFFAGVWATSIASDVTQNKEDLESKATVDQVAALAATLARIEAQGVVQIAEQKITSTAITKLETKVEALEKKID